MDAAPQRPSARARVWIGLAVTLVMNLLVAGVTWVSAHDGPGDLTRSEFRTWLVITGSALGASTLLGLGLLASTTGRRFGWGAILGVVASVVACGAGLFAVVVAAGS